LVECGTVAYCPTVIASPSTVYQKNLPLIAQVMEKPDLAPHILGIHLEGPFISPERGFRGAHNKKYIVSPNIKRYEELQKLAGGKIAILTLAPEIKGAMNLIKHITKNSNTVVSLGHHNAGKEIIKKACNAGATCVTHLGNGIFKTLNRHHNPLWTQLAEDNLTATFITDGFHIPTEFIKVALRAKTVERFAVVSDSSPIAGLPAGEYELFGQKSIIHKNGKITTVDENVLAGSNCNVLECMNYLRSLGLLSEDELWKVGFDNPLKVINKRLNEKNYTGLPEIKFKGNRFYI